MPTYRYSRGAAVDLAAYFTASLNGFIDTVSTDEGYNPALAHPDVVRDAIHPTPVEALAIEIDTPSGQFEDLHNRYVYIDCVVHVAMRAPDADIVAAQERIRSYVSAVLQSLMADNTLGGRDVDAQPKGWDISGAALPTGELQLVAAIKVTVKREEN